MKKIILFIILIMLSGTVQAGLIRIPVLEDVYVTDGQTSSNPNPSKANQAFDTANLLTGYNVNEGRELSYLKFDLSELDSYTIQNAKLSFDGYGSASPLVKLYRVSDDSWSETDISWNDQPQSDPTVIDSIIVTNPSRYELDISGIISEPDNILSVLLNAGQTQGVYATISSDENNDAIRPYLKIQTAEETPYVVINEIYPYPNSGESEWIEFYNPTEYKFDMTGCFLEDWNFSPIFNFDGITVMPNSFKAIDLSSGSAGYLRNEDDDLKLSCYDVYLDGVAYGSPPNDPDPSDNAPKCEMGKSLGRKTDGLDTNSDRNDFRLFNNPTKGTSNKVENECEIPGDEDPCCEVNGLEIISINNNIIKGLSGMSGLEIITYNNHVIKGEPIC